MSYQFKGFVKSIDETRLLNNGAKSLTFVAEERGQTFNQKAQFEVYGAQKVDTILGFLKVDDEVEIHFNLNANEFTDVNTGVTKVYNKNSVWKINSL
jgi:hypothetical protein